jgi:arylsulfatase A-like enzyme
LLREGKGTTFEGGMREPTLFWWPGRVKPGVQIEMGATMDLLPTFCALAGVDPPGDRTLDGYDLSPLLLGKSAAAVRDRVFYWREEQLWAVRVGPWKAHFITQGCYGIGPERVEHQTPELYHLEHDPSEKYNIAQYHPDVIERLAAIAEEHRASVEPVENELAK